MVERRRRPGAAAAVLVLGLVVAGCSPDTSDAADPSHASGTLQTAREHVQQTSTLASPSERAPRRPVARRCGRAGRHGPARAPRGARRVTVRTNLASAARRAPAGTTFWLARGVHRIGGGAYSQVRPKDGQRFVGAPGAVLDGQHRNLYAFGGHARRVVVAHLTITRFGRRGTTQNEGVVNHDAGHGWRILHNDVRRNAGAGVFVGSHNVLRGNCLAANGQYGFSAYEPSGVTGVRLVRNEITGNNIDDWERREPGCGCSGGGKLWETQGAVLSGNWVHHNRGVGIWADTNNTGVAIVRNYFARNRSEAVIYETSYNARIVANTFVRNGIWAGRRQAGFPVAAIYVSESGSDRRAGRRYGSMFRISHNHFVDNWSGVVAWENADRFAGSPANTSTDATTLVAPRTATVKACSDPATISRRPYYDDCRWKTQNLLVDHNLFVFRRSQMPAACTPSRGCGIMALVSNWGSYPDWSPYKGRVVEDQVTFRQHNRWTANRYIGPWRFMAHELWHTVSWKGWLSSPYRQDAHSTRR